MASTKLAWKDMNWVVTKITGAVPIELFRKLVLLQNYGHFP